MEGWEALTNPFLCVACPLKWGMSSPEAFNIYDIHSTYRWKKSTEKKEETNIGRMADSVYSLCMGILYPVGMYS